MHKVAIDKKTSSRWKGLPRIVRREYTVRDRGDASIPGMKHLVINNGNPNGYFPEGQDVTIIADAPAIGMLFDKWAGDVSSVQDINSSTTLVTIGGVDLTIQATYVAGIYTLTVNDGSGDGAYNYNDVISLIADAPPVWTKEFDQWVGDVGSVVDVFAANTTIAMPPNDAVVSATYKDISYSLTVVNGSGDGSYLIGTVTDIIADSAPYGKKFNGWIGDISNIDAPHLPYAHINMLGNYNVEASYTDIVPLDPDAGDGYYDVPDTPPRDAYDLSELANTPVFPDIDRYFDIPDHNSKMIFNQIQSGVNTSTSSPGGNLGKVPLLDTDFSLQPWVDPIVASSGIVTDTSRPGGNPGANPGFSPLMDPFYIPDMFLAERETLNNPIVYGAPDWLQESIADATALVQSGFIGGSVNIGTVRNNDVNDSGIYSANGIGDWIGVEFASAIPVKVIWWYSLHRGDRIRRFVLERYDGGNWTKIPLVTSTDQVTLANVDEGEASNSSSWKKLDFDMVSDTQFRIRIVSTYGGDNNCGVTEFRVFKQL